MLTWRCAKANGKSSCGECPPTAGKDCRFSAQALAEALGDLIDEMAQSRDFDAVDHLHDLLDEAFERHGPAEALDYAGRLEEIVDICFWLAGKSGQDPRRQAVAEAVAWLRRLGERGAGMAVVL